MKSIFYNTHNLKKEDINEEVVRVKALIINSKNEILLGNSYNEYQFPGGHLKLNEDKIEGLIREIKEETGLAIEKSEIRPFMSIKYYSKNDFNSGLNRFNKIYYYVIKTDSMIDLDNTNYTDHEKDGDFKLYYVNIDDVEDLLIDNANKYPSGKSIAFEMLQVLFEYKNELEGR